MRKVKPNGEPTNITAGMLQDEGERNAIINQENGFQFMRSIRCSPAYWSLRRSELMAIIRQFGKPRFFITFSAAEMEWYPFLWMLDYISRGCPENYKRPSPEEVKLWTKEKKKKKERLNSKRWCNLRSILFPKGEGSEESFILTIWSF
ncbi:hypothetical protein Bpfe_013294 [Biomphalaria pfeifferi]|uniref:Helitron helicase-like domain-containing protein n=1 Tax=Biomphalaria pfeifferi TaxID=112525 RepID=A0AAD8FBC0_BIOPF|nr:hypothetical protein Bpfe_013294 [Biomphalaria pfeifferi]